MAPASLRLHTFQNDSNENCLVDSTATTRMMRSLKKEVLRRGWQATQPHPITTIRLPIYTGRPATCNPPPSPPLALAHQPWEGTPQTAAQLFFARRQLRYNGSLSLTVYPRVCVSLYLSLSCYSRTSKPFNRPPLLAGGR